MSKTIFEETLSCLRMEVPHLGEITADLVCLGWSFTAVRLSTGDVGLCHTPMGDPSFVCCRVGQRSGTLAGSPATELAELAKSWNIGDKAVGLATINALSEIALKREHEQYTVTEGSVLDQFDLRRTDTVAMVGNIKPFVPVIKSKTSSLQIFERGGSLEEGVLPDIACEELLPQADIVVITGSAIANGTLERLLQLSSSARSVAVVGPSASIIPDPLFRRGVDVIGGVIVTDPDRAMQIVAEGGGTPQLKAATRFIVIKPKRGTNADIVSQG